MWELVEKARRLALAVMGIVVSVASVVASRSCGITNRIFNFILHMKTRDRIL